MRIADHLHLPLGRSIRRQDVIVNSFGVDLATCVSMDHVAPLVHAANCHDEMLAALKSVLVDIENMTGGAAYGLPIDHDHHPWSNTVAGIRAAIAKAER